MANQGSPSFKITLDGAPLSASALKYLLKAEFHESLDEMDSLSLTMLVPPNPTEVTGLAKPGSSYTVKLGQGESFREVSGSIIEVSHSRSVSTPWTITFQGLDKMHELTKKQAKKVRKGSDSTVVSDVASECGLSSEVEEVSATGDYSPQLGEDYATFLLRVAKANDYMVRVETDSSGTSTLRFSRRISAYQSKSVTLTWGTEIESIDLRASLREVITGVKVRGWCSAKGEWVKGQATSGDLANFSGGTTGAAMAESAFGEWVHEIDNAKVGSSSRAKAVAVAELQSKANTFVTGTVECPGVPDAVSGARLTIQEAGSPLSGDFVIHETIHSLTPDAGYRTTIHFLSDSLPA